MDVDESHLTRRMMASIGVNKWMLMTVMSYQKDDGWHWSERADVDESHVLPEG